MATRKVLGLRGALVGLAGLAVLLGVAELVAIATGPDSAPSIAIGQNLIAHIPDSLKDFAITHFGENDKTVLLASIAVGLVVIALLVGVVAAATSRLVAVAGVLVLGAVASLSAATQPTASPIDVLPSVIGMLLAIGAVVLLLPPARSERTRAAPDASRASLAPLAVASAQPGAPTPEIAAFSRRHLLTMGVSLVAFGAGAYVLGKTAINSAYSAVASRAAVRLPRPKSSSPALEGTGFDTPGLSSYITSNADFYRVDTALVVPQLTTEAYRMRLHGMVSSPRVFTFDELVSMELVERTITLVCVSNPVGGPYLGNARWLGVPLADLLRQAGLDPKAEQLFMTSSDGMTISADLETIMDGRPALLALGMNGEPLPFKHGFPVRAIIPGIYGYASACKWLVDLEVTTYAQKKAYWTQRGYAEKAPIKLESKIDTPSSFAQLHRGPVVIAGSAWCPTIGISRVQVKIDDGRWREASLAAVDSVDTWRLWRLRWDATPGSHNLEVRAIDRNGRVQTAADAGLIPNGASGRESLVVTVS